MLLGVILIAIFKITASALSRLVNFRMIATPSNAMDIYNDFFSRHDLTYFCQIRILKPLLGCPYQDQLSIVMARAYELGNFNASLFSTEGIASVGPLFAPVSVLRMRARHCPCQPPVGGTAAALHPDFRRGLPQILLNVPLTTTLLSHGAAILFLLWYITPRSFFPQDRCTSISRRVPRR